MVRQGGHAWFPREVPASDPQATQGGVSGRDRGERRLQRRDSRGGGRRRRRDRYLIRPGIYGEPSAQRPSELQYSSRAAALLTLLPLPLGPGVADPAQGAPQAAAADGDVLPLEEMVAANVRACAAKPALCGSISLLLEAKATKRFISEKKERERAGTLADRERQRLPFLTEKEK